MLLPKTKEREHRFKLALRMGLPIFALIVAFISHTLVTNYHNLELSFFIEAIFLLVFSIYFIFYLIYSGYEEKITDDVTKAFTREYFYKYVKGQIKSKKEYTLLLISIDNINDINNVYGMKNGDKVLKDVVDWVVKYLKSEKIEGFPIGHIKAADIVIGLEGDKSEYTHLLDMMCLKSTEYKVDDIEVKISGAASDTNYSKNIDYLIEHLFELQENRRYSKWNLKENSIDPSELEALIITAIKNNDLVLSTQEIEGKDQNILEYFVKLKGSDGRYIFPKKYLKVVNKLGLAAEFDLMVLEQVLSLSSKGQKVALSILPASLRNEKFLAKVKELMCSNKELEIIFILYEMEYYSNIQRFNRIIKSLKEYNIFICVDRIGSIHTSFLYMRELDINYIRYDSYYSHYEKLEKNRAVIEGFNEMAHQRNILSWIKNIEEKDGYNLAKKLDIDFIQGKYLSEVVKIYENK